MEERDQRTWRITEEGGCAERRWRESTYMGALPGVEYLPISVPNVDEGRDVFERPLVHHVTADGVDIRVDCNWMGVSEAEERRTRGST